MARDRVTRQELLACVGGAGAAGLAGCSGALESGGSFVCTDIVDGSTERREDTPLPFPFTFAVPTGVSEDERLDLNLSGGRDALDHSIGVTEPGSDTALVRAPGTDGVVRETTTLTVDPAR